MVVKEIERGALSAPTVQLGRRLEKGKILHPEMLLWRAS